MKKFGSRLRALAAARWLFIVAIAVVIGTLVTAAAGLTKGQARARQPRDQVAGNRRTLPGPDRDRGPSGAAEDDYAHRAYPAGYVPFKLTADAKNAWRAIQTKALESPNVPALTWTNVGPSIANFPDVLTFSGTPYTTSGRVTALAIDPLCDSVLCRVWVGAAGGGVWRTDNALDATPSWTFVSGGFATNAIGTLTYDAAHTTLYAGTGEPNASADSEAGFGIYKSTDGGTNWTHLAANTSVPLGSGVDCTAVVGSGGFQFAPAYSGPAFDGRAISSIVVDPTNPNILYVGSARAVRGVSSVSSGGAVTLAPGLPPYGFWKSTDGGANFTLLNYQDVCLNPTLAGGAGIIQSSFGSSRGVHAVALDPGSTSIVYAGPFPQNNALPLNTKGGVWRSTDSGATWTQIKNARNPARSTDRASFAVTAIAGGFTRMYVGIGNDLTSAANQAHVFRTDDAVTATDASFTDLTNLQQASAAPNQTINYCTGQCWYDNTIYSPPGKPDVVYAGGSYDYSNYGFRNNGRSFLRSTNAGVTFTDMTWDSTTSPTPPDSCCQPNPIAPNGMHPDSHAIVEIPGTDKAIFGSDGGLMRSNGAFVDISSQCTSPRGLSGTNLSTCQQLLSAVPGLLGGINVGLSTLQFQSVSVDPFDNTHPQGGTQDNGTFESYNSQTWPQIIYGDGGQSGFSSTNSNVRFNTFTSNFHDVNFHNGDPLKWLVAAYPIFSSGEGVQFYPPIIADPSPAASGTIFEGSLSVWRTQDWGNQAALEANPNCPEFTGSGTGCGDFVRIGPAGATNLTASAGDYRGTTRAGGNVAALARAATDTTTLWAATTTGRVFVSKNANALNTAVLYTRIDTLDANSPGRFISGISVDPANTNHAFISYSSYSALTPGTPGHIFSVTFNPAGPTATWTNLDGSGPGMFPDFPATGVVKASNSDLYASNDWGVLRLPNGASDWEVAGTGLPMVEVAGLTISPDGQKLYAATHGRSVFAANLPPPVIIPPFADFRDVRHTHTVGPDVCGTGHTAINFAGSAGSAGDTWITVYDATPGTPDEDPVFGTVSLSEDVLIKNFNNKKGDGLLALFNEGATDKGLALIVYDAGNTDTLVLGTVSKSSGQVTPLTTVPLGSGIAECAWYRLTMDVVESGANVTVTGKVFRHTVATDPNSPLGAQVGGTLTFSGPRPAGVNATGEVGIVASAISAVVDSSVTNFRIEQ